MSPEHERHMEIVEQIQLSREVMVDVVESLQMLGGDRTGVDWYEDLVRRTAERLYCVRLGMWSQIDPHQHPDPASLGDLARHCWHAATILADVGTALGEDDGVDVGLKDMPTYPLTSTVAGERPH
jgi:hypothetical protein